MASIPVAVLAALDPTQVANAALWVQILVIAAVFLGVLVVRPKDR